eukprot:1161126-Pelagomonas_calceolata.AAC.6
MFLEKHSLFLDLWTLTPSNSLLRRGGKYDQITPLWKPTPSTRAAASCLLRVRAAAYRKQSAWPCVWNLWHDRKDVIT